jgi:hypothetical protein
MEKSQPTGSLQLEAMAIAIPEFPRHPNRVPFSGVLTILDSPSDRAPAGAAGHRVVLPRRVAEAALPSLLGMAVDYAPGLRGHDVRRKIGVITQAEIAGRKLTISGYLFGKDFPEVVRELRAKRERLGMSYEVTEVRVADPAADIWKLERVVFTGAAILDRSAAAYQTTSLAASHQPAAAGRARKCGSKGEVMDEKIMETLDVLAQSSQQLAAECASLRAAVEELRRAQESTSQQVSPGARAGASDIEARVNELRRQNEALRAQAELFSAQVTRKTIPPKVLTLLAKSGVGTYAVGANGQVELPVLDKALEGLPVEHRIAVKSQLARAGAID